MVDILTDPDGVERHTDSQFQSLEQVIVVTVMIVDDYGRKRLDLENLHDYNCTCYNPNLS